MPLKLMYITNKPIIAKIAEDAGVDCIFIDLEVIGKQERQGHLDSVKSSHKIDDITNIKKILTKAELLVRVNPIYDGSKDEIEKVIAAGADTIMLPMFKTLNEVKTFIEIVSKRAKVLLLLETKEAVEILDDIMLIDGIDEFHLGLNDLHLAYKKKFMFELLIDGTINKIVNKLKESNYRYGIGGIARIGYGLVPAEYIIIEQYRLESTAVILSKSFCNANYVENPIEITDIFKDGIKKIRYLESEILNYSQKKFEKNYKTLAKKIKKVVKKISDL